MEQNTKAAAGPQRDQTMSVDALEQALTSRFDFNIVSGALSDMKKGIKQTEKREKLFKQRLISNHQKSLVKTLTHMRTMKKSGVSLAKMPANRAYQEDSPEVQKEADKHLRRRWVSQELARDQRQECSEYGQVADFDMGGIQLGQSFTALTNPADSTAIEKPNIFERDNREQEGILDAIKDLEKSCSPQKYDISRLQRYNQIYDQKLDHLQKARGIRDPDREIPVFNAPVQDASYVHQNPNQIQNFQTVSGTKCVTYEATKKQITKVKQFQALMKAQYKAGNEQNKLGFVTTEEFKQMQRSEKEIQKFLQSFNGLRGSSMPNFDGGKQKDLNKDELHSLDMRLQVTAQKGKDKNNEIKRQIHSNFSKFERLEQDFEQSNNLALQSAYQSQALPGQGQPRRIDQRSTLVVPKHSSGLSLANQGLSQVTERHDSLDSQQRGSPAVSEEGMHVKSLKKTTEIEQANEVGTREERKRMAKNLKSLEQMQKELAEKEGTTMRTDESMTDKQLSSRRQGKAVRFGEELHGRAEPGTVASQPFKMPNAELQQYLDHLSQCDTHSLQERRTQLNELTSKQWIYLLLHSNLQFCPYTTFEKVLRDRQIMNDIATSMLEDMKRQSHEKQLSRNQLEYALKQADKDLFVKYRDKVITYDQLRARCAEKNGFATYVVLDDFRSKLDPDIIDNLKEYEKTYKLRFSHKKQDLDSSFKGPAKLIGKTKTAYSKDDMPDPHVDEVIRSMESWEVDSHCIRSIKYKHKKKPAINPECIKLKMLQKAQLEADQREQQNQFQRRKAEVDVSPRKDQVMPEKQQREQKPIKKAEPLDLRARVQAKFDEYGRKALVRHRKFVRSQSAFISVRNENEKQKKKQAQFLKNNIETIEDEAGHDDGTASSDSSSITAKMNIPFMQYGRKCEFSNIQQAQNQIVIQAEERNLEFRKFHEDFHMHHQSHPYGNESKHARQHQTSECAGNNNQTHSEKNQKRLKKDEDKANRLQHLMFMKRIQENGKDILISDAHKKGLKVVDFIGNAMKQDIIDCCDDEEGAAGQEEDDMQTDRLDTVTGLDTSTILNTQTQQTLASSRMKTMKSAYGKKSKAVQKKAKKNEKRVLGQVEMADRHGQNMERFLGKMQSLKKYQGAEEHERYMAGISVKKDAIEREEYQKHGYPVIGLVGRCPKLRQQMWKSNVYDHARLETDTSNCNFQAAEDHIMLPVNDRSMVEVGVLSKQSDSRAYMVSKPNIAVIMEESNSRNDVEIENSPRSEKNIKRARSQIQNKQKTQEYSKVAPNAYNDGEQQDEPSIQSSVQQLNCQFGSVENLNKDIVEAVVVATNFNDDKFNEQSKNENNSPATPSSSRTPEKMSPRTQFGVLTKNETKTFEQHDTTQNFDLNIETKVISVQKVTDMSITNPYVQTMYKTQTDSINGSVSTSNINEDSQRNMFMSLRKSSQMNQTHTPDAREVQLVPVRSGVQNPYLEPNLDRKYLSGMNMSSSLPGSADITDRAKMRSGLLKQRFDQMRQRASMNKLEKEGSGLFADPARRCRSSLKVSSENDGNYLTSIISQTQYSENGEYSQIDLDKIVADMTRKQQSPVPRQPGSQQRLLLRRHLNSQAELGESAFAKHVYQTQGQGGWRLKKNKLRIDDKQNLSSFVKAKKLDNIRSGVQTAQNASSDQRRPGKEFAAVARASGSQFSISINKIPC